MSLISLAALARFAAEFSAFLVAVGGLALVALRPELLSERRSARAVLAAGFGLVGTVAFLEGSLLIRDRAAPTFVAARVAGIVALAFGSQEWAGGPRSKRLLWGGLVGTAMASGLLAAGMGPTGDLALGVGAAGLGVALRVASGRSIAARVAAGSAAILLLVVLVLSVSLSAVLSTTVRDDAGRRLDARAATEADFAENTQPQFATVVARNVALIFATNAAFVNATDALVSGGDQGQLPGDQPGIFNNFQRTLAPDFALAYINRHGFAYATASPPGLNPSLLGAAIGSDQVTQAFAHPESQRSSLQVFGASAFVVAIQPVLRVRGTSTDYPTAVVVVAPLGAKYLTQRLALDPNVGLAIATRTAVLGEAGSAGATPALLALAKRTFDSGPIALRSIGGKLSSTSALASVRQEPGSPVVAVLVVATPSTVVTDVRDKLLRTLFLLAMGGTLLAMALAAYAGERVSEGIRVLTAASKRIQAGNYAEPAGVRSADEVGVLGSAFDSMALSISRQTTELQLAAEEETALRNQLEAAVEGMGEALVAVDAQGRVTLFNQAAEELLGLDAQEVSGELVENVLGAIGEDGTALGPRLRLPSPARWSLTATVATNLGTRIPVEITSGALRGLDGAVSGAVLILRDLRPEREIERLKSEFLSRIGHELRTPLTGIIGWSEILLRRPQPEARARAMYKDIHDQGLRLKRVVQMLEFSAAADAGRSLLRSETVDVRSTLDDVVVSWENRLNGNHAISRRISRNLPEVQGDPMWLTMAIDELIANAVKFSPDGGKVTVSAVPLGAEDGAGDEDSPRAVQISVADHGVGMTEEEQSDAFTDFVQVDSSDTRRFGGLGLGLSLVKRVAEAHGGTVDVRSAPAKGSRFSMTIPALVGDPVSGPSHA